MLASALNRLGNQLRAQTDQLDGWLRCAGMLTPDDLVHKSAMELASDEMKKQRAADRQWMKDAARSDWNRVRVLFVRFSLRACFCFGLPRLPQCEPGRCCDAALLCRGGAVLLCLGFASHRRRARRTCSSAASASSARPPTRSGRPGLWLIACTARALRVLTCVVLHVCCLQERG